MFSLLLKSQHQKQKLSISHLKTRASSFLKLPNVIFHNVKTLVFGSLSICLNTQRRKTRNPFKCFFYFIGCTLGEWTEDYNQNIELIQIRLLFTLEGNEWGNSLSVTERFSRNVTSGVWLNEYIREVLLYTENQEWNGVPIQVASSSLNYSICWIAIFMSWILVFLFL